MKDLYTVQKKAVNKTLGKRSVSVEDLLTEVGHGINEEASELMKLYKEQRINGTKVSEKVLETKIRELANWVAVGYYALDLEIPEIEQPILFATTFADEIRVDAILICHHIMRSFADVILTYFCEEPDEYDPQELEEYMLELLSSISLLAEKLGKDLSTIL
jgi:hypothetical protein